MDPGRESACPSRPRGLAIASLATLIAAVILTGCSRPHPSAQRDEVVIGARVDDYPSPPARSQLGIYPLGLNICEPLVRLDANYQIRPLLATAWEYRGSNTWRFHLRPGVRFSNGQPFTSEAVRWTIAVAARREPHTFLYEDSVRIIDALTVELTPRQPNLRLLDQLVHPSYGILAPGSEPARGPIGTGPFRFAGYRRDEWIAVERNDRYWGQRPKARRLLVRFLPDETTRILSLESGAVDLIVDLPRTQAPRLAREPALRIVSSAVGRVATLFLNQHGPPPYDLLKAIVVRRAVAMSIDRAALIHDVWNGYGQLVGTIGPPAMLGIFAGRSHGVAFDRAGANALLDRAGWVRTTDGIRSRHGRRLVLTMISWPEFDSSVLEFLQGQLAAIGIELQLARFPDNASYTARLNAGTFDLDFEGGSQNDGDPIFLPALRFYSKSPVRSTPFFLIGPRFDRIIEEGLQATDRTQVQERSAEAMHLLVDEEIAAIPLAGMGRMYALRKDVNGFVPHPSQLNQQWSEISIGDARVRR